MLRPTNAVIMITDHPAIAITSYEGINVTTTSRLQSDNPAVWLIWLLDMLGEEGIETLRRVLIVDVSPGSLHMEALHDAIEHLLVETGAELRSLDFDTMESMTRNADSQSEIMRMLATVQDVRHGACDPIGTLLVPLDHDLQRRGKEARLRSLHLKINAGLEGVK